MLSCVGRLKPSETMARSSICFRSCRYSISSYLDLVLVGPCLDLLAHLLGATGNPVIPEADIEFPGGADGSDVDQRKSSGGRAKLYGTATRHMSGFSHVVLPRSADVARPLFIVRYFSGSPGAALQEAGAGGLVSTRALKRVIALLSARAGDARGSL